MKRKFITRSPVAPLVIWLIMLGTLGAQSYNLSRKLTRHFDSSVQAVEIRSNYSHIRVLPADSSGISVSVVISVEASSRDEARSILNNVRMEATVDDDHLLKIKTLIDDRDGFRWLGTRSLSYKINYLIRIPDNLPLDVYDDFGTLQFDRRKAPLYTHMDYGSVQGRLLDHRDNRLEGDYTEYRLELMRGGTIKGDFNRINMDFSFDLQIRGDYNHGALGRIKNLTVNGDFNRFTVKRVKRLALEGDYYNLDIRRLYDAQISGDFGKLSVGELGRGFHRLQIEGDYTNIRITNAKSVPYALKVMLESSQWHLSGLQQANANNNDSGDLNLDAYYRDARARALIKIHGSRLELHLTNPTDF